MNSNAPVFLRENAIVEPLVNRWYAWPYLISPLTFALITANHHVRVMESFVSTPQLHVRALQKPGMLGGPFIAFDASRTAEVEKLLQRTRTEQADLLELAAAVRALHEILTGATGSSLEPLYAEVPGPLSGFVELVYDLYQRPKFRIVEPLLYRSGYYKPQNQSLALSLADGDDRAFVLSTPRLDESDALTLEVPFDSPLVDALARARTTPEPFGLFEDALGVDRSQLARFFCETPPKAAPCSEVALPRVRYFGHACLLVQSRAVSLMFDPIVPYRSENGMPRFSFADLPDTIDFVVITHNHQDHAVLETLLQLRHRIGTIVVPASSPGAPADPSLKLMFRQLGFRSVVSIDELETLDFEGGSLTALPFFGEHGDLDIASKAAYLLRLGDCKIVCAADSNNIEPSIYSRLKGIVGDLDLLFIGMECRGAPMSWLYGPLLAKPLARSQDQSRRLNGSDAARALDVVDQLKPSRVFVYAMGSEPWLRFISSIQYDADSEPIVESNAFLSECRSRGISAERLYGARDIPLSSARS